MHEYDGGVDGVSCDVTGREVDKDELDAASRGPGEW